MSRATTDLLDLATAILEDQPFSRLLGTRITECRDGVAVLELDVDARLRQQHGLVHGGVFAYLADNAVSFAAGSVLGPSVLSTALAIDLLGNTREGSLRAVASVEDRRAQRATVAVEIVAVGAVGAGATSRVCARGRGTVQVSGSTGVTT